MKPILAVLVLVGPLVVPAWSQTENDRSYDHVIRRSAESTDPQELVRLARILELGGRFAGAAAAYARAVERSPDSFEALIGLGHMNTELGRIDAALTMLRRAERSAETRAQQRRAAAARAWALALGGDTERSLDMLRALVRGGNRRSIGAYEAELFFVVAHRFGPERDRDAARRLLEREFPDSPLLDSTVSAFPSPANVLSIAAVQPDDAPLPPLPPVPDDDSDDSVDFDDSDRFTITGVQTGSFRDPENAAFMLADIRDLGFSAALRSVEREDGTYYRVIVPIAADQDPQELIVALKEQGVEGFLVVEPGD